MDFDQRQSVIDTKANGNTMAHAKDEELETCECCHLNPQYIEYGNQYICKECYVEAQEYFDNLKED